MLSQMAVQLGPWRIISTPTESDFRELFARFRSDKLNDWNEAKQRKIGKLGIVTAIYDDDTVTMMFEDLEQWDFPFEALEPSPPPNVTGFRFITE
jgi:hypothetical protein